MIDLDKAHLTLIKNLLNKYVPNCEVRVFGSRVTGKAKPFSDLDLALVSKEKIDWQDIERLKEALSETNLPILVDIVDWADIDDSFRKIIEEQYETL